MSSTKQPKPSDDKSDNTQTDDQTKSKKKKKVKKAVVEEVLAKVVKPPRVVFNCHHTQYHIIKDVARKEFGWRVSMKDPWAQGVDWDIAWTDLAPALDRFPKVKTYQKINHFPGMFQIARKNYLARNLKKMKKSFPKDYKFFPKTWLLPYERNELSNQMQNYNKKGTKATFIVKPECMSQGKGIFITKRIDQIDQMEHLVVQKYLRTPYLIDGYKFDLRIYVLVTNVQPLRIFMHREGLGRFASEKYKLKAFNNPFIHLTNYAINKDNENFTSDELGEKGHKRSLQAVYNQLEEDGVNIGKLKQEIQDIIVKTLISIQPDLVHNYRTSQPGDIFNNMCFEILGFDVIIDKKGRPLLLEVNHAPSFNDDTALDKQVKRNLLVDTFRLLNVSLKEKQRVLDILKEINEQRMIGAQKGSKQLQSIQRQDLYIEKLKERDIYENENLFGYEKLYPPITPEKEIDTKLMDQYKVFQEHAKKYMMDFKVANAATVNDDPNKQLKRTKTEDKQPKKSVIDQVARFTQNKRNAGVTQFFTDNQQVIKKNESVESTPSRQMSSKLQDNPQSCMFEVTNQSFKQEYDTVHNINQVPIVINQSSAIVGAQRTQQYQHAIIDQIRQLDHKMSRSISPQIAAKHIKTIGLPTYQHSQDLSQYSPNSSQTPLDDDYRHREKKSHTNKTPYEKDDLADQRDSQKTLLPQLSKSQISVSVRTEQPNVAMSQKVTIDNALRQVYDSTTTKHSHRTQNSTGPNSTAIKQQIMQYQFPILDNKSSVQQPQRNHFQYANNSLDNASPQNQQSKYFSPQKQQLQTRQGAMVQIIDGSSSLSKRQKSQLQIGYKMAYYQQLANQQQMNLSIKQLAFQPQASSITRQPAKQESLVIQGSNAQKQIIHTKKTLNQLLNEQLDSKQPPKKKESATTMKHREELFQRLHSDATQPQSYGNLNSVIQKLEKRGNNVINRLLPQLDKLIAEQQRSGIVNASNKTFTYVKINNLNNK